MFLRRTGLPDVLVLGMPLLTFELSCLQSCIARRGSKSSGRDTFWAIFLGCPETQGSSLVGFACGQEDKRRAIEFFRYG